MTSKALGPKAPAPAGAPQHRAGRARHPHGALPPGVSSLPGVSPARGAIAMGRQQTQGKYPELSGPSPASAQYPLTARPGPARPSQHPPPIAAAASHPARPRFRSPRPPARGTLGDVVLPRPSGGAGRSPRPRFPSNGSSPFLRRNSCLCPA